MRDWRAWAVTGVLGALAGALRVPFAALPGVQPSTALVVVAGQAMGPGVGAGVGVLVPLVSNILLGHGPWTPAQMLAWGLVGLLSGLLPRLGRAGQAVWGGAASLLFGAVMNLWLFLLFVDPGTRAQLLFTLARSLPFDAAHAAATAAVLLAAGPRLDRLLTRGRVRLLGRPPRWRLAQPLPKRSSGAPE